MAKNNLTPFEQAMKNSLESMPVGSGSPKWDDLSQRLDQVQPTSHSRSWMSKLVVGIAAVVIVAGLVLIPDWNNGDNRITDNQLVTPTNGDENRTKEELPENEVEVEQPSGKTPQTNNSTTFNQVEEMEADSAQENVSSIENQDGNVDVTGTAKEFNRTDNPVNSPEDANVATPTKISEEDFNVEQPDEQIETDKVFRKPTIILANTEVCQGEPCKAALSFIDESWTVKWYLSDGRVIAGNVAEFSAQSVNDLTLYAQIQTEKMAIKTDRAQMKVNEVPSAKFSWNKENLSNDLIPFIAFKAEEEDGVTYNWDFGNSSNNTAQGSQVKHYYANKGMYNVTLHAKNESGCVATSSQVIGVNDNFNLLAPTSFSPNNDGLNDTWLPATLKHFQYEFTLEIMDKNNNVVYNTSDAYEPWDGRVNGKLAERGDFFFWRAFVNHKGEDLVNEYGGRITITK